MSSGHANLRSFVPSVCGSSLSSSIFIFLACILKLISLSSSQLSLFLCNLSQLFLRQNSYDRQSKILRLVCLTLVIFCQGPPHTSRGCEPRRGRQCWRGQSWCQSWWWRRAPEHMDKHFLLVCIGSFFKHISATNLCFISRLLSFVQIFLRNFRIVTVLEEFHFET